MTVARLHKILGRLIEEGHGRKRVCVAKRRCNHPLESRASVLVITDAVLRRVWVLDRMGRFKRAADGNVAVRTVLAIEAEHSAKKRK